ncbi:MAG: SusD/RagB family nutrient-binding outer membrane lipoprotein [Cytophagales bacterium]|nr:SusD/RagB family nutrient-binding outer membrane lipoprotein [Cytophagales bacterium]
MKIKKLKYIVTMIAILSVASSCDEFDVETTNPNTPLSVANNPELVLTNIQKDVADRLVNDAWNDANLMAQYSARIVFTAFDQFEWGDNGGLWQTMYRNIRNAQQLYDNAVETEHMSYQAVSLILKSWMFQVLTDIYGDVPYSEAVSARQEEPIIQPKYDAQRDIYLGILADLEKANSILGSAGLPAIRGDIYNGEDLDKWRKFANSLRLRAYLRLSEVEPQMAQTGISNIFSNKSGNPYVESNDDNITLTYLSTNPNVHPRSEASGYRVGSFNEYRMSETLENVLKSFDDPRMMRWFEPTAKSVENGNPEWAGMLNGVVDGTAYSYKGGDAFLSKFGDIFYFEPNTVEAMLFMASESHFILAEAAQRGWISSDAKSHYDAGILANFQYWGVDMPGDYLTRPGVAYDGDLETIITQKWLSLLYVDYQGFCEFKRTGYPSTIKPGPDAFYPEYPSRYLFPNNEQQSNNENRLAAVQNMGASDDDIRTSVWWEGD